MKGQIDYLVSRQAPSSLTHLIELFIIGRLTKSEGTRQRSARARFKVGFAATVDNFWKPTHSKKNPLIRNKWHSKQSLKFTLGVEKLSKHCEGPHRSYNSGWCNPQSWLLSSLITQEGHNGNIFWVAYLKLILWSPRISLVFEGFNMRGLNQAWTQY